MNKVFTSDYILEKANSEDIDISEAIVWEIQEEFDLRGSIEYQLTDSELQWLDFINGRYSIADYLYSVMYEDDNGNFIAVLDFKDFSMVLDDDCEGMGKAVMLADDTALQFIFFCGYEEGKENEN